MVTPWSRGFKDFIFGFFTIVIYSMLWLGLMHVLYRGADGLAAIPFMFISVTVGYSLLFIFGICISVFHKSLWFLFAQIAGLCFSPIVLNAIMFAPIPLSALGILGSLLVIVYFYRTTEVKRETDIRS